MMRDPRADPLELERARGSLRNKLFGGDDDPFRVGRYVVHGKVGAGGLGVVYSAWDPELDRRVALKFVRADRRRDDDGTEQRRLLREARSIAQLIHPNVVQVFDVGTHEDQVFFAMQLVDGASVRTWLASGVRSWEEIAEVFLGAARGLAAAHKASLVHRDFKPDNLVVDADGRAVVVDFGLARSGGLSTPTDGSTPAPRTSAAGSTHSLAGTPGYIAPELLEGTPATPKSDQWAFCVAFYEALFGAPPSTGDSLAPPRTPKVPRRVIRLLERGLQRDPRQRHPSMEDVGDELQRALRARTSGAFIVGALVVVGLGAWAYAARPAAPSCEGGLALAEGIWSDERRTSTLQALEHFGTDYSAAAWPHVERSVDEYLDAWSGMHRDACESTARGEQSAEMLDRRMACLDDRLTELDQGLATIPRGEAAMNALAIVRGISSVERCADLARHAVDDPLRPPEDLRETLHDVTKGVAALRSMYLGGLYQEGHDSATQLIEQAEVIGFKPTIVEAKFWRAHFEDDLGQTDASFEHGAEVFAAAVEIGHDRLAMRSAWLLGVLEGVRRLDLEAALAQLAVARGFAVRAGLEDTAEWAQLLHSEGYVYSAHGRPKQAVETTLRALEIRERVLGPDHPDVAASLLNLTGDAQSLGQLSEALDYADRCASIYLSLYGPRHPDVAMVKGNRARVLSELGQHEEAASTFRELGALFAEIFGEEHPATETSYTNLGFELLTLNRDDQARQALLAASASATAGGRSHAPPNAWTYQLLCEVELRSGNLEAAEAAVRTALEGYEGFEVPHMMELPAHTRLARVLLRQDRAQEAIDVAEAGLALLDHNDGLRGTAYEAAAQVALARALWSAGQNSTAITQAERALTTLDAQEATTYVGCLSTNLHTWLEAARSGTDPESVAQTCDGL